jgi:hypothetical protein
MPQRAGARPGSPRFPVRRRGGPRVPKGRQHAASGFGVEQGAGFGRGFITQLLGQKPCEFIELALRGGRLPGSHQQPDHGRVGIFAQWVGGNRPAGEAERLFQGPVSLMVGDQTSQGRKIASASRSRSESAQVS